MIVVKMADTENSVGLFCVSDAERERERGREREGERGRGREKIWSRPPHNAVIS